MSNQRSILSFFSSSAEPPKPRLLQPKPPFAQQTQSQQQPPPPPSTRFVPPPLSRHASGPTPPPPPPPPEGMAVRTGGSPAPQLDLPPIPREHGRRILAAAGAVQDGDDLVFPSSSSSSSRTAAPRVVFPRDAHVPDLVSVNAILLPVRYPDSFYKPVADGTRLASLFNRVVVGEDGQAVGGVVCRLEPSPFSSEGGRLAVYIQSLALLSPYRGRGLVAAALDSIVATVAALNASASAAGTAYHLSAAIDAIYAHVWTESEDALQWYAARGFVRQGARPLASYYHALRPNTAWVVRRDVGVADALLARSPRPPEEEALDRTGAGAGVGAPPPLSRTTTSQSYQNARPETEWNDLPADMMAAAAAAAASSSPSAGASAAASAASSRNVSRSASRSTSRNVSRRNLAEGSSEGDGGALLAPPLPNGSQSSSRSSSTTGRKKRERAYPAAMFQ